MYFLKYTQCSSKLIGGENQCILDELLIDASRVPVPFAKQVNITIETCLKLLKLVLRTTLASSLENGIAFQSLNFSNTPEID